MEETKITVTDIKQEFSAQDYYTCTFGDDAITQRAIENARLFVRGKVLAAQKKYEETDEVIRSCIISYAQYRIFAFVNLEERAKNKYIDTIDLLRAYYGNVSSKQDDAASAHGGAVGFVIKNKIGKKDNGN